jgi:hypothetical protein
MGKARIFITFVLLILFNTILVAKQEALSKKKLNDFPLLTVSYYPDDSTAESYLFIINQNKEIRFKYGIRKRFLKNSEIEISDVWNEGVKLLDEYRFTKIKKLIQNFNKINYKKIEFDFEQSGDWIVIIKTNTKVMKTNYSEIFNDLSMYRIVKFLFINIPLKSRNRILKD